MDIQADRDLVRAARAGDRAAFSTLATRYEAMLCGVARRVVGENDLAYDLAQESLLQAYLSLDRLRDDSRFRSWLYGIVLNVCRMYLKTARINHTSLEALVGGLHREPADHGPTPEEIAERMELRRLVLQAVQTLSPANREVVLLFYYEDFSLSETADALGISITAVKGRLHKARAHLRETLLPNIRPLETQHRMPLSTLQKHHSSEGAKAMIPIQVVDVIRKETSVEGAPPMVHMQTVLYDKVSHRALVIWVGEFEGFAIMRALTKEETPRPMTQTFIARLLTAADAQLERVEISTIKEDVYFATAFLHIGDETRMVDARPSDAIALALEMGAPLLIDETIIQENGLLIPEEHTPIGGGIASIKTWVDGLKPVYDAWIANIQNKSAQEKATELEAEITEVVTKAFGKP